MNTYKLILEDNYQDVVAEIVTESDGKSGTKKKYIIRGLFSSPDERNKNGRIYPRNIWESALQNWNEKVRADPSYRLMELEHPPRASINKWEAVAKIRKMEFGEDGKIYGEAEILDNDANPKIGQLKALIDAGIPIGVSTRGTGKLGKGNIVEDYNLITVDIVSNPSNKGSDLSGSIEFNENWVSVKDYVLNENGEFECADGICQMTHKSSHSHNPANDILNALENYIRQPILENQQSEERNLIEKFHRYFGESKNKQK